MIMTTVWWWCGVPSDLIDWYSLMTMWSYTVGGGEYWWRTHRFGYKVFLHDVSIRVIEWRCYRFGRKKTMLYYFALKIAGIIMSVFGRNYTVFVVGRFCIGCGHVGYHHPGIVLGNTVALYSKNSRVHYTVIYPCSALRTIKTRTHSVVIIPKRSHDYVTRNKEKPPDVFEKSGWQPIPCTWWGNGKPPALGRCRRHSAFRLSVRVCIRDRLKVC